MLLVRAASRQQPRHLVDLISFGDAFHSQSQAVPGYAPACFNACPQPTNSSSVCVVRCYMRTVLGPEGGTRRIDPTEGMPVSLIAEAWQAAFADPAEGGCPEASGAVTEQQEWPLSWGRRPRRGE